MKSLLIKLLAFLFCGQRSHQESPELMLQLGLTQRQDWQLCRMKKSQQCAYCMSLFGTGMQKIQKLGSYVFQTQGSRKYEDEQPYMPTG